MSVERIIAEYADQAQLCWQAPREGTEANDYDGRTLMAIRRWGMVYRRLSRDGLLPLRTQHRSGMTTEAQEEAERLAVRGYENAYAIGPIPVPERIWLVRS